MTPSTQQFSWSHLAVVAALVIAAAAVSGGCNDMPSPVGAEFLPDTAQPTTLSSQDTLLIEAAITERWQQPIFNSGVLYIGRFHNLEARTLLRFTNIPDTLPHITATNILEVSLLLTPERYTLGDSTGGATFVPMRVHKVLRPWTPKATWDTLFATGDAGVIDPTEVGVWNDPIPLRDTAEPLRIELTSAGRELIAEWLRFQADSVLRRQIYGIALIPAGTATAVRSFATQAIGRLDRPVPMLEVVYRPSADSADTIRLTAGYAASFISPVEADTIRYLVLQPGIQYVPVLRIRLDALPPLAAIHRAELRLFLDTTACWTGNRERSRMLIITPSDTIPSPWTSGLTATYDATSRAYISKQIAPPLEYWLRKQQRGTFLISLPATELYGHLDRLTFIRSGTLEPQLFIVYSRRPQP
ncbi:MAG: hypothetical protein RMJ46_00125 [Bacteroidota bacterium]|nr:hypothetical protein [Bacteroidota bacterium]